MSAELLILREHVLPHGNALVVAVQYQDRRPPAVLLGVFRDGAPQRTMMVFRDGFDALARVLDAHRRGVDHSEDVPGPNAVLRLEARGDEIHVSRHADGRQLGVSRVVRADEVPAVAEALAVARESAR